MKLESEYQSLWEQYSQSRDPQSLKELLKALDPVIKKGVNTFGYGIPTLYGRARLLAKDAIDRYDPAKGSLKSHIMLNLQRLQRYAPQTGTVIDISETQRMLAKEISNAEKELEDKYNRPPSDQELADYLGLSIKKIQQARSIYGAVPTSAFEDNVEYTPIQKEESVQMSDKERLWREAVYQELSPIQQYIAERRLGLFGHKIEPVEVIAKRLKLSPAMVSYHMKAIQQKMMIPSNF